MTSPDRPAGGGAGRFRSAVAGLPGYTPIPEPDGVAGRLGLASMVKLDTNEMPYGPLPGVPEAVAAAAARSHRYPDLQTRALTDALASAHGIDALGIVVGNGSVALIQAIVEGATGPHHEVVYSWRSFEAYPLVATVAGARCVPVPRSNHAHDLDALLAAITPATRVVILCDPSNPTGTLVAPGELRSFLRSVPGHVLVILDQAYHEFAPQDADAVSLTEVAGLRNVVALRSFSKAWGLAGLRVGWSYAHRDTAAVIRKCVTPFSVNTCGQAAAVAALAHEAEMNRRVREVGEQRAFVTAALRARGIDVPASHANYLWLPLGGASQGFTQRCEDGGVLVRGFDGEGVRVTIGTPPENQAFLTAAGAALQDWRRA